MKKQFEGQVAIVTGAGEGIGYATARQLALEGASVLLNDIDEALAQASAETIAREGAICKGVGGDVSDISVVQALVNQAVEDFGRLDCVVANAGLTLWNNFLDYKPEDFERVLSVNLRGSFFLAQAAAKQMRRQGSGGRMVLMSSVTGRQAVQYLSVYSMSKAALEMLAKSLVIELSPLGITVNAVAPGATVTPRNLADDPNYEAVWNELVPLGKTAQAEDIANAVLFLLSPAAGHITGQTIVVDGGWTVVSPMQPLDFVENKNE